ncbi:chemotaxis protein CheA [Ruegeria pomeroyi]|nr:chemotaxis protein CheA [Ruegeria pomeroyi]
MVQNNKVLTVSYGTFSCTLEGFDDSFDTMKAIAEYFRDLAADDRYFGAEPPQPDADMLARIAEREIARQVEARRDEKGIVLRAAAPAALVSASVSEPVPADPAPATSLTEAPAAEVAPAQPEVTAPKVAEMQPEPFGEAQVEEATEETSAEAPLVDQTAEAEIDEGMVEDTDEDDSEAMLANISAQFEDLAKDEEDSWDDAEINTLAEAEPVDSAPETPAAPDSIAAKLQRIRAVVSRNEQGSPAQTPYTEDEHASNLAELDTLEAEVAPLEKVDSGLAARFVSDMDEPDEEAAEEAIADETSQTVEDIHPRVAVRVTKIKRSEIEIAEEEADLPMTGSLSPEDEDDLLRELAAVEAEYLAERNSDQAYDDEEDDEIDLLNLDEEDEDTSDVDGSLFSEFDEVDDNDTEEDTAFPNEAAISGGNDDISRLLAAADEKLDDPDLSHTRETYSRMRAAVAATRAERSAGGTMGTHSNDDEYRSDLSEVVRPRRPVTSGNTPRAQVADRPAPLKLVAEQRIDTKRAATSGPVRPRRVANLVPGERAAEAIEGGFAKYVAETGASGLHELLEAAASYLSFVEGHDQFSRPQLMNKVRQLDDQEFNREDGLRSFGQLLREGKLKKTASGQFTASGQIGFRPDNRAAG